MSLFKRNQTPEAKRPQIGPSPFYTEFNREFRPVLDVSAWGRDAIRIDALESLSRQFNTGE